MRTKNRPGLAPDEQRWVQRVKLLPCGVCGEGGGWSSPSQAHHIVQGQHFTVIPLCEGCHTGSQNGIHRLKRLWDVLKKTELSVLNDTVRAIFSWKEDGS